MRASRGLGLRDEARLELAALKSRQFGVFERSQATALGVSDDALYREVRAGRVARVHRRVYRDVSVPQSWEQQLSAALLWAGEGSAVSHLAAAALWSLDGFDPGPVELTLPGPRKAPTGIVIHRSALTSREVTHVSGIRVTSATRTIFDVASVVDVERVEVALDSALRRGLTSLDYLQRKQLERLAPGRRGSRTISRLLSQRALHRSALDSALETKFLRLLRHERLPLPQAGYEIGPYRLDFAYPPLRLGIELDGYGFHSGKRVWQRDLERQNYLLRLGWKLLRFTWDDVTHRRSAVIEELRHHIAPTLLP